MKKTLYSLMLSDDVVQAVDAAHRMGTSRSNLVNQILAEYVSVPTPERRISDIFTAIEKLMSPGRELVPFFAPGSPLCR
jgi:metal-responsive CopG/Arc/MetJ family transcriptional regulator